MIYALRYFFTFTFAIPEKTNDWEPTVCFRKRQLIDGTFASGALMMRMIDGTAHYRLMTEEEDLDFREETSI